MYKYPLHLQKIIQLFKKFPGVGNKTAERFAFELLTWNPEERKNITEIIEGIHSHLRHCENCGCLSDTRACQFCTPERANSGILCLICSPKDAFSIENTQEYNGLYHVLGHLLSPLDGIDPSKFEMDRINKRITQEKIQEVLIALDATLEGDATALYLKQQLSTRDVKTSRLAFGIPMGTSLDYVDEGTLAKALLSRSQI